jgi:hypothetical protein
VIQGGATASFFWKAAGVSLAAGISAWTGAAAAGLGSTVWLAAGWFAAAVPGVAAGTWLAGKFGKPGVGFVAALGAAMGLRAAALTGGLVMALQAGDPAPWTFLLGFGAGFVPLSVFEAVWFTRRTTTIR